MRTTEAWLREIVRGGFFELASGRFPAQDRNVPESVALGRLPGRVGNPLTEQTLSTDARAACVAGFFSSYDKVRQS